MEGDLQRVVGANLRRHREGRGLSQEAFADVLGMHRTYVGGLERGERNLTLRSVERLAAAIGVEPLALLVDASDASAAPRVRVGEGAGKTARRRQAGGRPPG